MYILQLKKLLNWRSVMPGVPRFAIMAMLLMTAAMQTRGDVDSIILGNTPSETAHHLTGINSDIIKGGYGESARRLLPGNPVAWTGGTITFTIKTDPEKLNYITTKLWGSDRSENRLYFVCDGKMLGYRHLGDIDMLDIGSADPFYNNHFYYITTPLPLSLTHGKTSIQLEIRSQGRIWGYGQNWADYQKDMVEPSRGIYAVYTHLDPAFVPDDKRVFGTSINAPKREKPGIEVFDKLKLRVNNEIDRLVSSTYPLSQVQMQFLAEAYHVGWCHGYHNQKLVDRVINGLDSIYKEYLKNPHLAESDPATYNADWFGLGICGEVLFQLNEPLRLALDKPVDGMDIRRRNAYADMLYACREWHRRNRRMYTNQSMINDTWGIYYANKGL